MKNKNIRAVSLIIIAAVILIVQFLLIKPSDSDRKKNNAGNGETEMEEAVMKREIGNVIEENNEYFVIENIKGEKYSLDKSSYPDFKAGDRVMLSYSEREKKSDGTYHVTPILLDHMKTQPEKAGD